MSTYLSPGVYVEEKSSGTKPISSVASAIAGFVGTNYGSAPSADVVMVTSFREYENSFGPVTESSDILGNSIKAFYQNGGATAYIASAHTVTKAQATLVVNSTTLLQLEGMSFGDIKDLPKSLEFAISSTEDSKTLLTINSIGSEESKTELGSLTLEGTSLSLKSKLNAILNPVGLTISALADDFATDLKATQTFSVQAGEGALSSEIPEGKSESPRTTALNAALDCLAEIDPVTMLLIPEVSLSSTLTADPVYNKALAQCERLKDRVVFIDPPSGTTLTTSSTPALQSSYAVFYYPRIKVASGVSMPPSAFVAGAWCKNDSNYGYYKSPAGTGCSLIGVSSFDHTVSRALQDGLNPKGINVLKMINGVPSVWGARTLSSDPEWRYISVRRTFMIIEESIQEGIQWSVFESNNHALWSSVKLNIESYLMGQWRSGALLGQTSSEAFYVKCGLGTTMTQGDIDAGNLIVEIGIAALRPAEFVIIRIQQHVSQA